MYNQSNIYTVESTSKDAKSYKKKLQFTNDKISKDSLRFKNRWDPPLLGELSPTFLRISLTETQRKLTSLDANKTDAHMISSSFLQQASSLLLIEANLYWQLWVLLILLLSPTFIGAENGGKWAKQADHFTKRWPRTCSISRGRAIRHSTTKRRVC